MKLYLGDNIRMLRKIETPVDAIYADCVYENEDFPWVTICYELLKDNGVFFVQTDYHTVADYKMFLDYVFGKQNFINWLIYIQEWGGISKRAFPKKHDDILFYAKGKDYKFYYDRIMIPKVTAGTALDKRGDGLKIPMDVFADLGNFSTLDKERVKWYNTGKNVKWQKPLKLINRLLLPTTDKGDVVLDPFMGTGTTGVWCKQNNRHFIGIEYDNDLYHIAEDRLSYVQNP